MCLRGISLSRRWIPIEGKFTYTSDESNPIIFNGRKVQSVSEVAQYEPIVSSGALISDTRITNGTVSARVTFSEEDEQPEFGFIFGYQATNPPSFYIARLGAMDVRQSMYGIRQLTKADLTSELEWRSYAEGGDPDNLDKTEPYDLAVEILGSRVRFLVNGIAVIQTDVPERIHEGNVGIWCRGSGQINVTNFSVQPKEPKAFVVMKFGEPFDTFYKAVIEPICRDEMGIEPIRIDKKPGPGQIIADIMQEIAESSVVIAEITATDNPNVFFEVGYAHALRKPTILIARSDTALPFDVSSFRVIFYDDTIGGKKSIEENLLRHLEAVMGKRQHTTDTKVA